LANEKCRDFNVQGLGRLTTAPRAGAIGAAQAEMERAIGIEPTGAALVNSSLDLEGPCAALGVGKIARGRSDIGADAVVIRRRISSQIAP